MKIKYSKNFKDSVFEFSKEIKKQIKRKLEIMSVNLNHPSLRTKKKGTKSIYESSVNMDIRITWQYEEDGILLRNIGSHDEFWKILKSIATLTTLPF